MGLEEVDRDEDLDDDAQPSDIRSEALGTTQILKVP